MVYVEISPIAQLAEQLTSKHVYCVFHHHVYADEELNSVRLMFQRQPYVINGLKHIGVNNLGRIFNLR